MEVPAFLESSGFIVVLIPQDACEEKDAKEQHNQWSGSGVVRFTLAAQRLCRLWAGLGLVSAVFVAFGLAFSLVASKASAAVAGLKTCPQSQLDQERRTGSLWVENTNLPEVKS